MWPRCKPNRSQSFKVKLSERRLRQQLAELRVQTLLQEETTSVPIASWTPASWVVLNTSMVLPGHGEIGVLPFVPIRRRVSPD